MDIRIYSELPDHAIDIRNEVFVEEQGFREEFDGDDSHAIHIVGFVDGVGVATSRVLKRADGSFLIGRIAVRRQHRKKGLGAEIVAAAEAVIKQQGGKKIFIHSQMQAMQFYSKIGYLPTGDTDEEDGCPHCMMLKTI